MAVYRLHRNKWEKGLVKVVKGKKRRQGQCHETVKEAAGTTTSKAESSKLGRAKWWTELGS
jgi:hypothetical protein